MSELEQLKEQVRRDWTANAAAWNRYSDILARSMIDATNIVVDKAELAPGLRVLDLASGTGEPAFTVAARVAPGEVLATDLVPEMLARIEEAARARGLDNLRARPADMEALPFGDGEFDRVTSRWGIMFAPDTPRALGHIKRVLKPGGRASFLVWGPPTQPFHAAWLAPFASRANLPAPPPTAPTPFRFAKPGSLSAALTEAGFHDVVEEPHTITATWTGAPDEIWQVQRDLVPQLLTRFLSVLSPEQAAEAEAEVKANYAKAYDGSSINLQALVYSVTAVA